MLPRITRRKVLYGSEEHCDVVLRKYSWEGNRSFLTVRGREEEVSFSLAVPGKHNALNAIGALAVADELSIPWKEAASILETFQGVQRRFQYRGCKDGRHCIDDYAHHPSELKATLRAVRERYPEAKVHAVFQPHRYSRLNDLFPSFCESFIDADHVTITKVYAAGELPLPGISGESLAHQIRSLGKSADFIETNHAAMESALNRSREGDVIISLGAGDLPQVYRDLFPPSN
jgi:UDP-N-acetylmuramate--alanine ligase